MVFILDASTTISWVMSDELSPAADHTLQMLRNQETAIVPGIWWYEIRNILVVAERRGRIAVSHSDQFLSQLAEFDIKIAEAPANIMELSRQYRLAFYDAAYLALAQREHLPIATLDKALQQAATAAGIPLLA